MKKKIQLKDLAILFALIFSFEGSLFAQADPCDFDGDGDCDCVDINALNAAIATGSSNLIFDLDSDGVVDFLDKLQWLFDAGLVNLGSPYSLKDLNLDGSVNLDDYNIWLTNSGTSDSDHCDGDISADGLINDDDRDFFLTCDFNDDGSCDCSDVVELNQSIALGPYEFSRDLDFDGDIDLDDKDVWLSLASDANGVVFSLADVNLNGAVDLQDFNIWKMNEGESSHAHCAGELNADGMIDEADFLIWLLAFNGGTLTWTGDSDTNWHQETNWTPMKVPISDTDVSIPQSSNDPVILSDSIASAKSIAINANAHLMVLQNGLLNIDGHSGTARSISILSGAVLTVAQNGTLNVTGGNSELINTEPSGQLIIELGGLLNVSPD